MTTCFLKSFFCWKVVQQLLLSVFLGHKGLGQFVLGPVLFQALNIILKSIDLLSLKSFSISKALNNGKYVMTYKHK